MGIAQSSLLGAVGAATAGITAGIGIAKQDELVKGQKSISAEIAKGQEIELANQEVALGEEKQKAVDETASIRQSKEYIGELKKDLDLVKQGYFPSGEADLWQSDEQRMNDITARKKAIKEQQMHLKALTETRNARTARIKLVSQRLDEIRGGTK